MGSEQKNQNKFQDKIQDRVQNKVQNKINAHGLIAPGDTILMGVSGGADSVCLFLLLRDLYRDSDVILQVMHINHHLREDAAKDAAFVRQLCARAGVPYTERDVDVQAYMKSHKVSSTEEAARILRYEAFREYLSELPGEAETKKLAVAHTLNDNAETVLHHLFRGSGLKGLGGIRMMRDHVIRPLLCLSRAEVEEYLRERGQEWRTDSTNEGDDYARNRIRHHILPLAETEINAQAAEHIHAAAQQLGEAEDFICASLQAAYERIVTAQEDGIRMDRAAFLELHPYLQERLALRCLQEVSGCARDVTARHVHIFLGLFALPCGKMLDLPHGLFALRRRDSVELLRKN